MPVKDSYSRARATKKKASASFARGTMTASERRRASSKIKKSPVLLIIILALAIGIAGGFFMTAVEGVLMMSQQFQRKMQIIKENKIVGMYRKQYEQKGIRFRNDINMNDMKRMGTYQI